VEQIIKNQHFDPNKEEDYEKIPVDYDSFDDENLRNKKLKKFT